MKKNLIAIMLLVSFMSTSNAQQKSCCAAPSATSQFAAFASSAQFVSLHESPLPINYMAKGKMITFPTPDGKTGSAYFVGAPSKSKNYLFVFHEYWGLNDYIKRMGDLYADSLKNVNVIALDLYDGKVATDPSEGGKLMQGLDNARAQAIIKGAVAYAGKDAKIATVGWCMGGGWSMQGALAAGKNEVGCVMYYGMPEADINKLKTLNSDVLFIWANKDQWINADVKDQFVKNMQTLGKKITVKEYTADHAFANPSNPHYDQPSATAAQVIVMKYFRKIFSS